MTAIRIAIGLLLISSLVGCRNDCQQVCLEMADLFDSCGVDYSQAELLECLEQNSEPDESTLGVCEDSLGELEELMEYKSESGDACSELEQYDM